MPSPPILSSAESAAVESTCSEHGLSAAEFKELQSRCVGAKATAYCPYSKFRVGAAVLSVDGVYFNGANVENASYPVGTCAERVAFGKAVTEGHRRIRAVAVATDISPPATPCGMCRQLLVDIPFSFFFSVQPIVIPCRVEWVSQGLLVYTPSSLRVIPQVSV